jgi:hypothetical protein
MPVSSSVTMRESMSFMAPRTSSAGSAPLLTRWTYFAVSS